MNMTQSALGIVLSLFLVTAWSADKAPTASDKPASNSPAPTAAAPNTSTPNIPPPNSPAPNTSAPGPHVAVLNGNQVVEILDQTVEWYRTLGAQQQSSSQPSDLLIYYANQQTANQVVALAFDIARANAELLSTDASTQAATDNSSSSQAFAEQQAKLKAQRQSIQAEIATRKQTAGSADLTAKLSELQGELEMVGARLNLLNNMQQFVSASSTSTASVSALKAHIDAIAASVPASLAATVATAVPPSPGAPANKAATPATTGSTVSSASASGQPGIWELGTEVLRLHTKGGTIEAIDRSSAALEQTFRTISSPPLDRLKELTAQSDALATQADTARGPALKAVRDQLDTLAWLFQQTSDIWIPLGKEGVLLEQYRHNLKNWRDTVRHEYGEALKELGIRLAILAGMLLIVFAGGEVWRRLVIRYTHEPRRRYQLLLIQKLTLWTLVILVVALTFVTEISSFATFAGLITAGLAVAMQSVLVSLVGYFFLIGKYGLRVGDRVQIGTVSGEVISIGLVRLHLMEMNTQGSLGATGRVVAFANSIVFQTANGLFRQIPGVDFTWHESVLTLPAGSDYASIKEKLTAAVSEAVSGSHEELSRQTKQIEEATASDSVGQPVPQVQLRFAASGVEAIVRYPVHLQHEAETDERVSREIFKVLAQAAHP